MKTNSQSRQKQNQLKDTHSESNKSLSNHTRRFSGLDKTAGTFCLSNKERNGYTQYYFKEHIIEFVKRLKDILDYYEEKTDLDPSYVFALKREIEKLAGSKLC